MSDDAYIPPSERRITSQESLTVPCGVLASHAVADSIARELYEALEDILSHGPETVVLYHEAAENAVERYERIMAGDAPSGEKPAAPTPQDAETSRPAKKP